MNPAISLSSTKSPDSYIGLAIFPTNYQGSVRFGLLMVTCRSLPRGCCTRKIQFIMVREWPCVAVLPRNCN
jgi:hypothetical protein